MTNKEEIPKSFNSPEEAGEFWDTHSAADYWDQTEESEAEFDISERVFSVTIDEKIYQLAQKQAKEKDTTVGQIINSVLERNFLKSA